MFESSDKMLAGLYVNGKKAFTEVGSEAPAGGNLLHEGKSNDQYLSLH